MSQSVSGVKCSRCNTDGLGWCVSRKSGKHYLAYLVPTEIVGLTAMLQSKQLLRSEALLAAWHGGHDELRQGPDSHAMADRHASGRVMDQNLSERIIFWRSIIHKAFLSLI